MHSLAFKQSQHLITATAAFVKHGCNAEGPFFHKASGECERGDGGRQ